MIWCDLQNAPIGYILNVIMLGLVGLEDDDRVCYHKEVFMMRAFLHIVRTPRNNNYK